MAEQMNVDAAPAVHKVVLGIEPAEEVASLIEDRPGTADEDLLDDALDAIEAARAMIPPEDQDRAAAGEVVAVELTPDAVAAVDTLIRRDELLRAGVLHRMAQRLRGKIASARRKRARRS